MNKKSLAVILSKLKYFDDPKSLLEQYQTDSEIAADILWVAYLNNDIKNRIVADFGSGNGIFGIGSLILGAKKVYFVEIDKGFISLLKENLASISSLIKNNYRIFNINIKDFNIKVDTVIQNPPFGVQRKHTDKIFLDKAFEVSNKIYSLHKIESKQFIKKYAEVNDFSILYLKEYNFLLKRTMHFHKKERYSVKVGCWVLQKRNI